VSVTKAGV